MARTPAKPETNGNTKRLFWISVVGVATTVGTLSFGAVWWLSALEGRMKNVEDKIAGTAVFQSEQNRLMGRATDELQKALDGLQIAQADNCEQFAKIETQFGSVEAILNEDNIHYQRWKSTVDSKVFGIPPPGIYYEIKIPHELLPCGR